MGKERKRQNQSNYATQCQQSTFFSVLSKLQFCTIFDKQNPKTVLQPEWIGYHFLISKCHPLYELAPIHEKTEQLRSVLWFYLGTQFAFSCLWTLAIGSDDDPGGSPLREGDGGPTHLRPL